jgi:hypothetical protein
MVGVLGGGEPVRRCAREGRERRDRVGTYPGSWYVEEDPAVAIRAVAGVAVEK